MFTKESSAYRRIWNNTHKTKKEEMGIITNDGVLVLPNYENTEHSSEDTSLGYIYEKGKFSDPVTGKKISFSGTIHTHSTLAKVWLCHFV